MYKISASINDLYYEKINEEPSNIITELDKKFGLIFKYNIKISLNKSFIN